MRQRRSGCCTDEPSLSSTRSHRGPPPASRGKWLAFGAGHGVGRLRRRSRWALLVVQALAGDQLRVVLDGVDIAPYRGDPVAARGAVVQHQIDLADGDEGGEVLLLRII
jgi:hypothetical protein